MRLIRRAPRPCVELPARTTARLPRPSPTRHPRPCPPRGHPRFGTPGHTRKGTEWGRGRAGHGRVSLPPYGRGVEDRATWDDFHAWNAAGASAMASSRMVEKFVALQKRVEHNFAIGQGRQLHRGVAEEIKAPRETRKPCKRGAGEGGRGVRGNSGEHPGDVRGTSGRPPSNLGDLRAVPCAILPARVSSRLYVYPPPSQGRRPEAPRTPREAPRSFGRFLTNHRGPRAPRKSQPPQSTFHMSEAPFLASLVFLREKGGEETVRVASGRPGRPRGTPGPPGGSPGPHEHRLSGFTRGPIPPHHGAVRPPQIGICRRSVGPLPCELPGDLQMHSATYAPLF